VNPLVLEVAAQTSPRRGLEAKFSVAFCAALALADLAWSREFGSSMNEHGQVLPSALDVRRARLEPQARQAAEERGRRRSGRPRSARRWPNRARRIGRPAYAARPRRPTSRRGARRGDLGCRRAAPARPAKARGATPTRYASSNTRRSPRCDSPMARSDHEQQAHQNDPFGRRQEVAGSRIETACDGQPAMKPRFDPITPARRRPCAAFANTMQHT
jgi:hypothetical protein